MIRAPNALAVPQVGYAQPAQFLVGDGLPAPTSSPMPLVGDPSIIMATPMPQPDYSHVSPEFRQHIPGIFAGESGGDYDALFGFSNRPGGPFDDVRLTDMTVSQALDFANPRGEYGRWVADRVGRVATPMGAYQVVGTTLRAAMEGLGLTGNERMTPELQDRIGEWIYRNQGIGAWEGYRAGVTDLPAGARGGNYNASPSVPGAPPGVGPGFASQNALAGPSPEQMAQIAHARRQQAFNALSESLRAPIYTNVMQGAPR